MKEQFDKKLAKKIADTFSQHEEPFDPKEWEKLSKAYFSQPKRIFPWKWLYISTGIAAAVAVAFLLLPTAQVEERPGQLAASYQKEAQDPASQASESPSNHLENLGLDQQEAQEAAIPVPTLAKANVPKGTSIPEVNDHQMAELPPRSMPTQTPEMASTVEESIVKEIAKAEKTENPVALSLVPDETSAIASVQKWLNEAQEDQIESKKGKEAEPFRLGLMVAPQTISNATQTLNLGAGIMSEFSFSKRLKLDVGLAYARQSITPDSRGRGEFAVAQAADAQQVRMSAMSSNFITSSNRLSFGQVELPVNLKYRIAENKTSGWYLMSGISNMMYVNQQQVTTFNTANFGTANFGVTNTPLIQTFETVSTPDGGQGSVNVGQLLNLGVGFEQNLKNGTFVYIEPFYKLSLGNQTFINQQFSIGGINLRMNFQIKK